MIKILSIVRVLACDVHRMLFTPNDTSIANKALCGSFVRLNIGRARPYLIFWLKKTRK